MVVLKKIRGSALLESIAATVIITVVFVVATMILNNIFAATIKNNDDSFINRINEVSYFAINDKIILPFFEETDFWEINISKSTGNLVLTALNKRNGKEKKSILYEE